MSLKKRTARTLRKVAWRLDRPYKPETPSRTESPGAAAAPGTPSSAPGSRTASMFFDRFPRFYETSRTAPSSSRLNLRYEAMIAEHRDIFDGVRVLDIASHDGRWSLAALEAGAQSVVGIEARPELVTAATENLAHYGYGPDRVRFLTGDVHELLETQDLDVDVVLCLGFLYHTLRYNELLYGIRRTNARHLIIDTFSPHMMRPAPTVNVITERAQEQGKAAADTYSDGSTVVVGRPNLAGLRTMLGAYGYRVERLSDWAGLLRDNPSAANCGDYGRRMRVTVRCADVSLAS